MGFKHPHHSEKGILAGEDGTSAKAKPTPAPFHLSDHHGKLVSVRRGIDISQVKKDIDCFLGLGIAGEVAKVADDILQGQGVRSSCAYQVLIGVNSVTYGHTEYPVSCP